MEAVSDWLSSFLFLPNHLGRLTVRSLLPAFPTYVRILHPPRIRVRGHLEWTTWRDIAARHGTKLRPDSSIDSLCVGTVDVRSLKATWGELPLSELGQASTRELVDLFRILTPNAHVNFCTWSGHVDQRIRRFGRLVSVRGGHREYVHTTGPLEHTLDLTPHEGRASPNLWWVEGALWFVHTDIDLMSTYLGGPPQIETMMTHTSMEWVLVNETDEVS